ncbi:signal transduction histidine kinase/ABC-type Fe3+ transport system substrate-binding protein [Aminobacter sp. BE110]
MSAVLAFGAAVLMSVAWYSARGAADEAYDRLLLGAAFQIADAITIQDGRAEIELPVSAFELLELSERDRIFYRVLDPAGNTLTGYDDLSDPGSATGPANETVTNGSYRDATVRVARVARTFDDPQLSGEAVVIVAQTVGARSALARDLTLRSLFLVAVMGIIAIGGMIFAVRRALAPIGRLEAAIRLRDPLDLTQINTPAPRELAPFVAEINSFVERLNGRIAFMQQFIADAAHQLRTPIAALDGQVEMLSNLYVGPEGRQRLDRIKERTGQLARLANQLLSHAMVAHREKAMTATEFDLIEVTRRALDEAVPDTARDLMVSLYTSQEELIIIGDPVNAGEAIKNVIDNAVRHGASTEIRVRVSDENDRAVVEVEDDGSGIPQQYWQLAPQRFGLPSADTSGTGLGLSIASEVVAAHGGNIGFRRNDFGFVVSLSFGHAPRETPLCMSRSVAWPFAGIVCFVAGVFGAQAQTTTLFPVEGETELISIHAATDLYALRPLILDYQKLSPGTTIEVVEYVTNDLFSAAQKACKEQRPLGDLVLSSAVDQLVKLANDGCAQRASGQYLQSLPRWANWRDEVFGFTYEPIVIAYNRDLVPAGDVPRDHLELADLLRRKPEIYAGKIGTYDIRQSGIGYLLAFNDARQTTTTYGRVLESLGRANVVLRCCTSEILEEVGKGRLLLGYNMLASYAYERVREGYKLGIVMPADYTLVLSRGAIVPRIAKHSEAAVRFLDYLLSPRGQQIALDESFFFGAAGQVPPGVEGPDIATSGIARPIAIGPTLLAVQDDARRKRFLEDWAKSVVQFGGSEAPR